MGSSQAERSIAFGEKTPPLWTCTLGELIQDRAKRHGDRTALVMPWQGWRASYSELASRSKLLANSILEAGLTHGETIGIIAGNCFQYLEAFLGAARVGCPYVVLNNNYTPKELVNAVSVSQCRLLFIAPNIGPRDMKEHVNAIHQNTGPSSTITTLKRVIVTSGKAPHFSSGVEMTTYNEFVSAGHSVFINEPTLKRAEKRVKLHDVLNLQFTSGTTGAPKAAMLTHSNLINNGLLIGQKMKLELDDVVCCPPPLFHCFGLVIGFLAAFTAGCSIVFPSDAFDPDRVVTALMEEKCTALLGVPTMFYAELDAMKARNVKLSGIKTGLAAGSPVPMSLVKRLGKEMGMSGVLIAYGMTETSPVTLMTSMDDSEEKRLSTVGPIMPHSGVKVVDPEGNILPRGTAGEICTSGYALQPGYWKNEAKTKEVMKRDDDGILWMFTGDQGVMDKDGYCAITGRIKDIIIRGGENIFPVEIEEALLAHESITESSVVAIKNERFGEVVGCFLRLKEGAQRPKLDDIRDFVRQSLGRHKAPEHVFWIGDADVGEDYPKTASGKHQKHLLRDIGNRIVQAVGGKSKL